MNNHRGHLRQRFEDKIKALGFIHTEPELYDLLEYAREVFALGWPIYANVFDRILFDGEPIDTVAKDCNVATRTISRWLHGNDKDSLGAADWLLILLQIYREAHHGCACADTLHRCLVGAPRHNDIPYAWPILLCPLLDAYAGGGGDFSAKLYASLPWNKPPRGLPRLDVAWPCHGPGKLSPQSKLPGLLALLHRHRHDPTRFDFLCVSLSKVYWWNDLYQKKPSRHVSPPIEEWAILLDILNAGGGEAVAKAGEIADLGVGYEKAYRLLSKSMDEKLRSLLLRILGHTNIPNI